MLWATEKPILLMAYFPFNNTHHCLRWAPKSDSKNCSCNVYKDQTTQESNQNESSRSGLQHFVWLIPQVLEKKGFYMFAAMKEINDLNLYPKKRTQILSKFLISGVRSCLGWAFNDQNRLPFFDEIVEESFFSWW